MSFKADTKDPAAIIDYTVRWSQWLGTDQISASDWIVEDGIVETLQTNTTGSATIWLASGTAGEAYRVTNRIQTIGGRQDDRTIVIPVGNR